MKPKYGQKVSNLLNYYVTQRYGNFNLEVYVDGYAVYKGCLECYNGEASGLDVQEFFCDRRNQEIRVYA